MTTGISAADRAHTIAAAVAKDAKPRDIVSPGHVFPLKARPGGVLQRSGHTEGSVDLARLAGRDPAGVICEIMNEDGTMARYADLLEFAEKHELTHPLHRRPDPVPPRERAPDRPTPERRGHARDGDDLEGARLRRQRGRAPGPRAHPRRDRRAADARSRAHGQRSRRRLRGADLDARRAPPGHGAHRGRGQGGDPLLAGEGGPRPGPRLPPATSCSGAPHGPRGGAARVWRRRPDPR